MHKTFTPMFAKILMRMRSNELTRKLKYVAMISLGVERLHFLTDLKKNCKKSY